MTYAFTHMRDFPLLLREIGIWAFGLECRPWSIGLDLGAGILASELRFEPQVWDFGREDGIWALKLGLWPRRWDLGFKAGIYASKQGFKSRGGWGIRERRRRKFPRCVKV